MKATYSKFLHEPLSPRKGVYSDFDSRLLYCFVRENKPKKVVDFAPREGKTTSCILQALLVNFSEDQSPVEYFVFEKDPEFLMKITEYINAFIVANDIGSIFKFHFNSNIIGSAAVDNLSDIDFLFIDANHDYILAKWYVDVLFKKVRKGGWIHIHDIYYDKGGNGWLDASLSKNGEHPDYTDLNVMSGLYPSIFSKYYEGESSVSKFEGDIVSEYIQSHEIKFYSSIALSRELSQYHDFNCSLYFQYE